MEAKVGAVIGVYPGCRRTGVVAMAGADLLAATVLDRGGTPAGTGWVDTDDRYVGMLASVIDEMAGRVGAATIAVGAPASSGAAADIQLAAVVGGLRVLAVGTGRRLVRVPPGPYGEDPATAGEDWPSEFVTRAAADVATKASGEPAPKRWVPRIVEGGRDT